MDSPKGWEPWMRMGVAELDHDHQKILTACDLFADALAIGDNRAAALLLDALIGTTAEHFVSEERILRAAGYPLTESHMRHHDEARRWLRRLADEFERGERDLGRVAGDIKRFFIETLIPEDLHYKPYVAEAPARPAPATAAQRLAEDLLAAHGTAAQDIAEGVRASMRASRSDHAAMWDDVVSHVRQRMR
jgi:hemerythrin-like metal-binding protein